MPWAGPRFDGDFPSLGWGVLDWCTEFLPSPRDPSAPLRFTDEQALQIVEWFRVAVDGGGLVYRRGFSRRSKGWGKSPVEAAKAVAELAGPVRFAGWDAVGQPVGMPWGTKDQPRAWVQIGAISEDQTDNTWSVIHYLLTENDGKAADALGVDAGLTRCRLRGQPGAIMEPVTSAAGSREGQPLTYGVLDESHLMLPGNGGVRLAETIRRNVAKISGRSYETTNSYLIGFGSVAESSHKAVQAGEPGIFSDEVEAPHMIDGIEVDLAAPDEILIKALNVAYGDSWWTDRHRLLAEVRDSGTTWQDSARFFFNWPQHDREASGPITSATWVGLIDLEARIVSHHHLGLAVWRDHAAFGIAGRTADGKLFVEWMWQGSPFEAVAEAKRMWDVKQLPVRVQATGASAPFIALLREAGVEVVEVTIGEVAQATGQLIHAANGGTLAHSGQQALLAALRGAEHRLSAEGAMSWSPKSQVDISVLQAVTIAAGGVPAAVEAEFFVY